MRQFLAYVVSLLLNNVNEGLSRRESGSVFQYAGPVVPKPRLPLDLDTPIKSASSRKPP